MLLDTKWSSTTEDLSEAVGVVMRCLPRCSLDVTLCSTSMLLSHFRAHVVNSRREFPSSVSMTTMSETLNDAPTLPSHQPRSRRASSYTARSSSEM